MKKSTPLKVALFDPYLDVMGGGERHILSILQVLEDAGSEITIFWDEDIEDQINERLHLYFKKLTFRENIFKHMTSLQRLKALGTYDAFFYVTDGSYFFSAARSNFVFCMVPQQDLYNMTLINRIKLQNYRFITNSAFTQHWLKKWQVDATIIHPYISEQLLKTDISSLEKEQMILVVGRFFPQLHSKRHDMAITWFQDLQKKHPEYKDYTLHLVGSMKEEDQLYFEDLHNLAGHNPQIHFHPNLSFDQLLAFYQKSTYYWHFAGFEIDEKTEPEKTEHFGITPLEAMAAGCITYAYGAGGPKELIIDGENGYLFHTQEELFEKMEEVRTQPEKRQLIQKQGKQYVDTNFSYGTFRKRVQEIILPMKK